MTNYFKQLLSQLEKNKVNPLYAFLELFLRKLRDAGGKAYDPFFSVDVANLTICFSNSRMDFRQREFLKALMEYVLKDFSYLQPVSFGDYAQWQLGYDFIYKVVFEAATPRDLRGLSPPPQPDSLRILSDFGDFIGRGFFLSQWCATYPQPLGWTTIAQPYLGSVWVVMWPKSDMVFPTISNGHGGQVEEEYSLIVGPNPQSRLARLLEMDKKVWMLIDLFQ